MKIRCISILRQPNVARVTALDDPLGIDIWTALSRSEKIKAVECASKDETFYVTLTPEKKDYIKRQVERGNL